MDDPFISRQSLQPGQNIGNYTIIKEIGSGGMGTVYKISERKSQRIMAMKIINKRSNIAKKRFLREAELAATLQHKNIVQIFSADQIDDSMFLIMEYVEGITLDEWMQEPDISVEEAMEVCIQVAEALDYAHKKQIVHRDIKPSNIMLTQDGTVKIMDFGLAKSLRIGEYSLTKTGDIIGTPRYMAPEQLKNAKSREINYQIDIYSTGAILYEMITGKHMVAGKTAMQIMFNLEKETPIKLSDIIPEISPDIEIIWKKAVAPRKQRYQSMSLFLNDLSLVSRNEKIKTRSPISLNAVYIAITLIATCFFFLLGYRYLVWRPKEKPKPINTTTYIDGIIEFEAQRFEKAYKILSNSKSKDLLLDFYLGACLYETKNELSKKDAYLSRVQRAIQKFNLVHHKIPDHLATNYYLANAYKEIGQIENAKKHLQKCIEISPNSTLYYNELAEIYFDLIQEKKDFKDSFLCFENLKKVCSIEQGNLRTSELLFKLAVQCPHLQEYSWELIENMFFANKKIKKRSLLRQYLETLYRRTKSDYIEGLAGNKERGFYIHIAAISYLEKSLDFVQIEKGVNYYRQILLDDNEDSYRRFLAANSLAKIREFELLNKLLNKVNEIGRIVISSALREQLIPHKIQKTYRDLNFLNKLSQEENNFILILLLESFYIPGLSTNNLDKVSIVKRTLEVSLSSKNEKVRLAAAASVWNLSDKKTKKAQKSFKILEVFTQNNDETLRAYSYYHLLSNLDMQLSSKVFLPFFKKGLQDQSDKVNLIVLSFLLQNKKHFRPLESILYNLTRKNNKELALLSSCAWAYLIPDPQDFISFLRDENLSSFARCLPARFFGISCVFNQQLDKWRQLQVFLYRYKDVVFKANMMYIIVSFQPLDLAEWMEDPVKASVINGSTKSLQAMKRRANRFGRGQIMEQMILGRNKHLFVDPSPLIRQASNSSVVFLLGKSLYAHCENLLRKNDEASKLGASEGLRKKIKMSGRVNRERRSALSKFSSLQKKLKVFRPYNPYSLEQNYYNQEKKLLSEPNEDSLKMLEYAVKLYDSIEARYEYALALISFKQYKEASFNFKLVLERHPNSYKSKIMLAKIEPKKEKIYLKNIYKKIKNPFDLQKIANFYMEQNKYREVTNVYKKLFQIDPDNKEYILKIIEAYCLENNQKDAKLYVKWAIDLHINSKKPLTQSDFESKTFRSIKNDSMITNLPD